MNFRKKTIGNILALNHIWVAKRHGNDLVIHYDEKRGDFWFESLKDGQTAFDSREESVFFNTLGEAEAFVENFIQERLMGRIKRKARLSMEKRYVMLLEAVKHFVEKNSGQPEADELGNVLKKINEA